MLLRCRATVCSLIPSAVAMSRLVRPPATRRQHLDLAGGQLAGRAVGGEHGRAALVGPRAEPGERDPRRPQLHQGALPVARLPAGRRDRHAGLRRLVRHPQLGPGRPCPAQRGERGGGVTRRQRHRTGRGRGGGPRIARARHRQLAELVRRRARRAEVAEGERHLDPGGQQPGAGQRRGGVRQRQGGRRRGGPAPGQRKQRAAGLRVAAQLVGARVRLLRERVRPAAAMHVTDHIGRLGDHAGVDGLRRPVRLRRGGLPRAVQAEQLHPVDPAQTEERAVALRQRVAPVHRRRGPLADPPELGQCHAALHAQAVDPAGEHRAQLPGEHQAQGLVEPRQPGREVAGGDQHGALGVDARGLEIRAAATPGQRHHLAGWSPAPRRDRPRRAPRRRPSTGR